MEIQRITTDDESSINYWLNVFFAKNNEVWIRGGSPEPGYPDCSLVDLLNRAAKAVGIPLDENDPETMGEIMYEYLQYGPEEREGVLGFLNLAAIQATELRYRLKMIEDILGDGYNLDRLRELVEADRDGRCVVLPVKNGIKVYCLQWYFDDAKMRSVKKVKCRTVDFVQSAPDLFECDGLVYKFHDIGKTVFFTREAAEAALKGEQDG